MHLLQWGYNDPCTKYPFPPWKVHNSKSTYTPQIRIIDIILTLLLYNIPIKLKDHIKLGIKKHEKHTKYKDVILQLKIKGTLRYFLK